MPDDFLTDYSLEYPGEQNQRRQAYRVRVPGLKVSIGEKGEELFFPVLDLSVKGVAFDPVEYVREFVEDTEIELSLWLRNKLYLSLLKAKVVRVGNGIVACQFQNLDYRQELCLDKLVLEVQKKNISLIKKRRNAKNK